MKRLIAVAALMLVSVSGWCGTTVAETVSPTTGTLTMATHYAVAPQPTAGTVIGNEYVKGTLTWTSSELGNVTSVLPAVVGTIVRVTFNPGSPAPTDNYDVTLVDEDGFDVLAGLGANRHTTNTQSIIPFMGNGTVTDREIVVSGALTLDIDAAGDEKEGVIRIYLIR